MQEQFNDLINDLYRDGLFERFPLCAFLGWEPWSDWSACSASCGEGTQERRRFCRQSGSCHGYNKERRRCNMFSCQGTEFIMQIGSLIVSQ
jgi:hypothetical protein